MTQPFDGADATPDDETTDPTDSGPARPSIDLASALLIVGGITALVGWPLALILGALATGSGIQLFGSLISIVFLAMNAVAIATGVAHPSWPALATLHQHRRDLDPAVPDRDLPSPIAMFYRRAGRRRVLRAHPAPRLVRRQGRAESGRTMTADDLEALTRRPGPGSHRATLDDRRRRRSRRSRTFRRCATDCCSSASIHRRSASRPATTTRAGSAGRSGGG